MDVLTIEPSENSPKVLFDPFSLTFEISGESRPENAGKFYDPILQWLNQFHSVLFWKQGQYGTTPKLVFEFKLEYFNSTSAKYLLDVLKLVDQCHTDGCAVVVNWYYDQRDEDMKESGEEFSELIDVDFKFIAK